MEQQTPIISLYLITNLVNQKVYIGQSIHPNERWTQHIRESKQNNPSLLINKRMKHYGIENFTFEVIASCWNYDDANDTETGLVKQYDSHVSNGKGYNVAYGGMNAPKSEEWKRKFIVTVKEQYATWRKSAWDLKTPEEQEEWRHKVSELMTGHSFNIGYKHTEEWKQKMSEFMKKNSNSGQFTSERLFGHTFNVGRKHSQETKKKKSIALKGKPKSEEARKNMSAALNSGRFQTGCKPHNIYNFTEEQIKQMIEMHKTMTIREIAKHFGCSYYVIQIRLAKAK